MLRSRSYLWPIVVLAVAAVILLSNGGSRPAAPTPAAPIDFRSVERQRVLEQAEEFLNEEPVTVTTAVCPDSAGGRHDFHSHGDYWWPNPFNPGRPYIKRDGLSNPDNFSDHRHAMVRFSRVVGALASAYLLTGDERYAAAATPHLRAWFVSPETRMAPDFLYARAIRGRCTGRWVGVIDGLQFVDVARAVMALENSPSLPADDLAAIRRWFRELLTWICTHEYGIRERDATNNHSTAWMLQAVVYAELVGDRQTLDFCRKRFKEVLLPEQMSDDGTGRGNKFK